MSSFTICFDSLICYLHIYFTCYLLILTMIFVFVNMYIGIIDYCIINFDILLNIMTILYARNFVRNTILITMAYINDNFWNILKITSFNNIIMHHILIFVFDTTYADVRCINSGLTIMSLKLKLFFIFYKIITWFWKYWFLMISVLF